MLPVLGVEDPFRQLQGAGPGKSPGREWRSRPPPRGACAGPRCRGSAGTGRRRWRRRRRERHGCPEDRPAACRSPAATARAGGAHVLGGMLRDRSRRRTTSTPRRWAISRRTPNRGPLRASASRPIPATARADFKCCRVRLHAADEAGSHRGMGEALRSRRRRTWAPGGEPGRQRHQQQQPLVVLGGKAHRIRAGCGSGAGQQEVPCQSEEPRPQDQGVELRVLQVDLAGDLGLLQAADLGVDLGQLLAAGGVVVLASRGGGDGAQDPLVEVEASGPAHDARRLGADSDGVGAHPHGGGRLGGGPGADLASVVDAVGEQDGDAPRSPSRRRPSAGWRR